VVAAGGLLAAAALEPNRSPFPTRVGSRPRRYGSGPVGPQGEGDTLEGTRVPGPGFLAPGIWPRVSGSRFWAQRHPASAALSNPGGVPSPYPSCGRRILQAPRRATGHPPGPAGMCASYDAPRAKQRRGQRGLVIRFWRRGFVATRVQRGAVAVTDSGVSCGRRIRRANQVAVFTHILGKNPPSRQTP